MHKTENMNTENIQILVDQGKAREFCMIHNNIFDHLMKTLKPTEFTVLMVAIRKIHGFDKKSDKISISQFSEYTGLANRTVCNSLRVLIELGLLVKLSTDYKKGNEYTLNSYARKSQPKPNSQIKLCKKVTAPMQESHTQETHLNTDSKSKDLTRNKPETKVSYSEHYLKDIEVIRDNTTKRMKVIDKLYVKYCRAVKLFGQDHVSNAILGYSCDDFFKKGAPAQGKWNFEKLLNNETNLDMFAVKGENIKPIEPIKTLRSKEQIIIEKEMEALIRAEHE